MSKIVEKVALWKDSRRSGIRNKEKKGEETELGKKKKKKRGEYSFL